MTSISKCHSTNSTGIDSVYFYYATVTFNTESTFAKQNIANVCCTYTLPHSRIRQLQSQWNITFCIYNNTIHVHVYCVSCVYNIPSVSTIKSANTKNWKKMANLVALRSQYLSSKLDYLNGVKSTAKLKSCFILINKNIKCTNFDLFVINLTELAISPNSNCGAHTKLLWDP